MDLNNTLVTVKPNHNHTTCPPTPQANPKNGRGKSKESEPIPKQNEHSQAKANTYSNPRLKTGGYPRVETDIITPHKNNDTKYPAKPTPDPRVDPTTSSTPKTPKNEQCRK